MKKTNVLHSRLDADVRANTALWNWTNYKVLALKDDIFSKEHILNMLADLHERLSKIENKEP